MLKVCFRLDLFYGKNGFFFGISDESKIVISIIRLFSYHKRNVTNSCFELGVSVANKSNCNDAVPLDQFGT